MQKLVIVVAVWLLPLRCPLNGSTGERRDSPNRRR